MVRFSLHPIKNESINGGDNPSLKDYINGLGFLSVTKTLNHIDPYIRYASLMGSSKYNEKKFGDDKEKLINYYNSLGYRDASIEKDTVYRGGDGNLNIDIKINEGQKYYFGDLFQIIALFHLYKIHLYDNFRFVFFKEFPSSLFLFFAHEFIIILSFIYIC
jgi:outer membrane protein insertion porin family